MQPMSGRWVCQRCYESNQADATACARCGLARGASPDQASDLASSGATGEATPQWQRPAPSGRPAWLSFLLRFAWVGVIIVVAVVGVVLNAKRDDSGQITGAGTLEVSDLRVGDCFSLQDEQADSVSDVDAKPCAEEHAYELFHKADLPDSGYPSEDQFDDFLAQECLPAFNEYVGTSYQSTTLDVFTFVPTEDGWNGGDHGIQCAVYDPAQATTTGSLKASAR